MKLLALLIFLLVLVVAYHAYPFQKAIKLSKEIEEHTTPYEQHPTNPTMSILVAGDSTAVGTGAAKNEESTAGRLGAYYPNADITNLSENGLKLDGLEAKLKNITGKYDLALIQIGANDTVRLTRMKNIEKRIDAVLAHATERADKVIVLTSGNIGLSPVFKWPVSTLLSHRAKKVRNIYMSKITKYPTAKYVDLYKEKNEDIFAKDVHKYYAKDFFHPSGEGYAVWFDGVKKMIESK